MPAAKKNSLLRVVVPLVVIAAAIGIVFAIAANSQRTPGPQPIPQDAPLTTPAPEQPGAGQPSPEQPAPGQPAPGEPDQQPQTTPPQEQVPQEPAPDQPAVEGEGEGEAAQPPAAPAPAPDMVVQGATLEGLSARVFGPNPGDTVATVLGSPYYDSDFNMEVELTFLGAGVRRILLNKEFENASDLVNARERLRAGETNIVADGQYVLIHQAELPTFAADGSTLTYRLTPLAAVAIIIDNQRVNLYGGSIGQVWRLGERPGEMIAEIENASGELIGRVVRRYSLGRASYDLKVEQWFENLTDRTISFAWVQDGPLDIDRDRSGYSLLSLQRIRFGYTLTAQRGWQDPQVRADTRLRRLADVLRQTNRAARAGTMPEAAWPTRKPISGADELVWFAQTNRYFGMIVHPLLDPAAPGDKSFRMAGRIDPIVLNNFANEGEGRLSLRMTSPNFEVPPASSFNLSFGAYAGPLDERGLAAQTDDRIAGLQLNEIVVYNIGGMCAWCTFEWLGNLLLFVLRIFHDFVVFDWALSIILLVLVVRTILHPVFKKSQIGIQKFAKDMQRVQPKLKKLQEKYKTDRQKMMQEQQKLFRSEGISYTGMLGCLPMFLQSPIWIALYAMLYMNHELRHEPAFFGLFQTLSGGNWLFLADLARSDRFIPLPFGFNIPLLGYVDSINILPLLLGVVFYVQQKYMSPPPSPTMTDEQRAQQKMIKFMMVVLFPIFMYTAPAALTLYFVTNSCFAIIEGKWIRAHIDTLELDKHPDERSYKPKEKVKRVRNTATVPGQSKKQQAQEQRSKNRYKKRD